MLTITQIREEMKAIADELGKMRAVCENENREPNKEERKFANEKLARLDDLEEMLELEKRTQEKLDRMKEPETEPDKPPLDSKEERKAQEKLDHFASAGEFFQAVVRAAVPGSTVDRRLVTRAATGLQESVPSDGGFLVDSETAAGILKNVWDNDGVLGRVNKTTLGASKNAMTFNGIDETSRADGSRAGGIRGYWKGEAAEKTASQPKFRRIELKLNKLVGLVYCTDELLEDAAALEQTIKAGLVDEFKFKLIDAIINGTGAGQPLGILNAGCVVSVAKETGQAADTIVYENVNKMWSRLIATSRNNAVWVINQDCEPQLHSMSIAVGTGGVPVYMPAGGVSGSPYSTLFGRPVIPIEQCQTVGTTGDIMLCDFSKYLSIDKGGIKQDVSMHVRFVYDESVFRAVYRFDGQPQLGSAITPKYGAGGGNDTLSHFVKLDSRD